MALSLLVFVPFGTTEDLREDLERLARERFGDVIIHDVVAKEHVAMSHNVVGSMAEWSAKAVAVVIITPGTRLFATDVVYREVRLSLDHRGLDAAKCVVLTNAWVEREPSNVAARRSRWSALRITEHCFGAQQVVDLIERRIKDVP